MSLEDQSKLPNNFEKENQLWMKNTLNWKILIKIYVTKAKDWNPT